MLQRLKSNYLMDKELFRQKQFVFAFYILTAVTFIALLISLLVLIENTHGTAAHKWTLTFLIVFTVWNVVLLKFVEIARKYVKEKMNVRN